MRDIFAESDWLILPLSYALDPNQGGMLRHIFHNGDIYGRHFGYSVIVCDQPTGPTFQATT